MENILPIDRHTSSEEPILSSRLTEELATALASAPLDHERRERLRSRITARGPGLEAAFEVSPPVIRDSPT